MDMITLIGVTGLIVTGLGAAVSVGAFAAVMRLKAQEEAEFKDAGPVSVAVTLASGDRQVLTGILPPEKLAELTRLLRPAA